MSTARTGEYFPRERPGRIREKSRFGVVRAQVCEEPFPGQRQRDETADGRADDGCARTQYCSDGVAIVGMVGAGMWEGWEVCAFAPSCIVAQTAVKKVRTPRITISRDLLRFQK